MAWSVPDLSPAGNPVLEFGESLILATEGVSIYNGETRSSSHADGTTFLTSKRVVYVDAADPLHHSVATQLRLVKAIDYTPRFLAASGKVSLQLATPDPAAEQRTWICPICLFRNELTADLENGELPVCSTCGVRATPDVFETPQLAEARVTAPGECPQCTFHNHTSLVFCEMCGARLRPEPHKSTITLGTDIKLSFRRGGSRNFYAELERQLKDEPAQQASVASPETATFGIEKLELRSQQKREHTTELFKAAFQSPAALKQHIHDVMSVAAQIGQGEQALVVAGVPADPAAGLARQIADFLVGHDVLVHSGGMLTLHDLFAKYNRARGIRLVSPDEILQALALCEPLDLPIRVRTLGGLKVVVERGLKDRTLVKLMQWIKQASEEPWRAAAGFSAREVGEHFGWSVPIASEELLAAEAEGLLCRDEHTSGLRFFPNLLHASGKGLDDVFSNKTLANLAPAVH